VAIYCDGLSFHHSAKTKEVMDELNFIGVKAIAYCPETNAAEQLFKVIKKEYKFELL
jgi:transposase